eukprot:g61249.t1
MSKAVATARVVAKFAGFLAGGAVLAWVCFRPRERASHTQPLPIECRCGQVTGTFRADPRNVLKLICYCDDCQFYGEFLDQKQQEQQEQQPDRTGSVMDQQGGTPVYLLVKSQVSIRQGQELLQLCKLKAESPMHRWITRCCACPVLNFYSHLPTCALFPAALPATSQVLEWQAQVPTPAVRVLGKFARGGLPADDMMERRYRLVCHSLQYRNSLLSFFATGRIGIFKL